jgi:hypothetical protein
MKIVTLSSIGGVVITLLTGLLLNMPAPLLGADELAVVPPKARGLLSRFDERSQHYEVKAEMRT